MGKDIMSQIQEIQQENQLLNNHQKEVKKIVDKLVKLETGLSLKDIENSSKITAKADSDFEAEIASYFGLQTEEDKREFVAIMCNDSSRRFYQRERNKLDDYDAAATQG